MAKIQFRNKAHRDFVFENLEKCRHNDCYHQAFFYVMGISEETRMNIGKMFDFKNDCIVPEGMYGRKFRQVPSCARSLLCEPHRLRCRSNRLRP